MQQQRDSRHPDQKQEKQLETNLITKRWQRVSRKYNSHINRTGTKAHATNQKTKAETKSNEKNAKNKINL